MLIFYHETLYHLQKSAEKKSSDLGSSKGGFAIVKGTALAKTLIVAKARKKILNILTKKLR